MGKRRKAGNINPKKQLRKQGTAYYNREKEINYLLNNFTSAVYNPNFNLQNIKSYKQMNEIRMKLKKLFDQQGDMVWKKSAKRRRIYDEQPFFSFLTFIPPPYKIILLNLLSKR